MVTVLPPVESFGAALGRTLGSTAGDTFANIIQSRRQRSQQEQENREIQQRLGVDLTGVTDPDQRKAIMVEALKGRRPLNPLQEAQKNLAEARTKQAQGQTELFQNLFGGTPQNIGQQLARAGSPRESFDKQPQQQPDIRNPQTWSDDQLRKVSSFAGQPGEMGIVGNMAKQELDARREEKKVRTAKEKEFFKFNEPKLAEVAETERNLDLENARYNRLGELFSDQSKFPSSLTAALFSKDGQLNDLAYSQLTPEAQEAIKLIIDSTSNIKDTYGARVTNFDLQTYLKKLPSLLNTPEGKMRVLRDLQIMNRLNAMHAKGIQEIFNESGGTDKISFSEAQKRYKKKFRGQENELISQFITPEKAKFNEMPEPSKYLGRKIKNPETGEIFISDGNEWKPFRG